jgi:hypothetical protein
MGPIEKKIKQLSLTEGLSEETKLVLNHLKNEIKDLERTSVNEAYDKGYNDKERGKSPTWDYYSFKNNTFGTKIKFGQLS